MRLVFFGSGSFGAPTLVALAARHTVDLVVTQPDRRAGRARRTQPTPIAALAESRGLPTLKPERVDDPAVIDAIRAGGAGVFVVIAYGHKLGRELLAERFAINLHASLLPKYRGAAPINWAMINGETQTGLSVITLAQNMDAGTILAQERVAIDPMETAGELHDRLAERGPELVLATLERFQMDTLVPHAQDDAEVTRAPKLRKSDGTVRFDMPARAVRARIHGLTPWPGCTVAIGDERLKILRVAVDHELPPDAAGAPGHVTEDGLVACAPGAIRLLCVQPPGGKSMTFAAYRRGRRLAEPMLLEVMKPS